MNDYQFSVLFEFAKAVISFCLYAGLIYVGFWCANNFGLI